jgi:FixJ family two-component response regulator
MNTPTIYVVDDEASIREGLTILFEAAGYSVRSFASAAEYLDAEHDATSGCQIFDLRMPHMDGLTLLERIHHRPESLPVLLLSAYGDVPTTVRAIKNGAADFLTKPVNGATLLERVRSLIAEHDIRRGRTKERQAFLALFERLTRREFEILCLAINGKANKEISKELNVSHRTVENHRSRIFLKLGVVDLLDFMQKAVSVDVNPSQVCRHPPSEIGNSEFAGTQPHKSELYSSA